MALWRGGISVSAPEFSKTQDLTIAVDANSGAARTRDIILRSASDPSKTCTITVNQAEGIQQPVPVHIYLTNIEDNTGLTYRGATCFIDIPDDTLEYELQLGVNVIELYPEWELSYIDVYSVNRTNRLIRYGARVFAGSDPDHIHGEAIVDTGSSAPSGDEEYISLNLTHEYRYGMAEYVVLFEGSTRSIEDFDVEEIEK